MALVVEDGTGKTDSQSYSSVADADSYLAARGYALWASNMTPTDRENALVRATDFMESFRWKGLRTTTAQALAWPRKNVATTDGAVGSNVVPKKVKEACIELAFRAAFGPLAPDVKPDETGRLPYKEVSKVGPIDVETTWAARGQMATPTQPVFTAVDQMLAEYVHTGGGVYR